MELVQRETFSCRLLLNLNCKADGMSLCIDLGPGLKTSFQWRQKQTNQPTSSLAPNSTWKVVGKENWTDLPWAALWLQEQRDLKSGSTTRQTKVRRMLEQIHQACSEPRVSILAEMVYYIPTTQHWESSFFSQSLLTYL